MELHFDILDDLSIELCCGDYFRFLMINDLTIELKSITRIVEYYHMIPVQNKHFMIQQINKDCALDVIKWLKRHNKPEFDYLTMIGTCNPFCRIRSGVCYWGNYEIIRWCYDNQIRTCYRHAGDESECYVEGFPNKCRNSEIGIEVICALYGNNLETLRFLHENNYIKPDNFWERIIENCDLEIFKWAIENMDVPSDFLMIRNVISLNRLDIIEWFCDHVEIPEISVNIIKSDRMFKLLHDRGIKISYDIESINRACRSGNLGIIKWLIDNGERLNQESLIAVIYGNNIKAIEFVHGHYWFPIIRVIYSDHDFLVSKGTKDLLMNQGYIVEGLTRDILKFPYSPLKVLRKYDGTMIGIIMAGIVGSTIGCIVGVIGGLLARIKLTF